ncbi:EAL domain-containing protein [Nocardioides stalactiti]|uniref:EAL domain-containing protein n=1 Tax=Nocardioides stalactiti TaxID=2755356 RepID=UPI0016010B86|nr:EAL domain-containing protein [Nocardioides stalactiti]
MGGSSETQGDEGRPAFFVGRFRLGTLLKSGNGVDTHLARDVDSGDDVVVKIIDASVVHAAARLRFEHETLVLRELTGTGLVELHASGTVGDRLYLVQPFVPGRTLEAVLRDGPLPVGSVLRIGIEIAQALSVAHGAGVVHRDVKPANVVIDGTDPVAVTLVDFGFARSALLDESVREDLVGTVRYLAPEAAGLLSVTPDERSDLYAVGILLFECLVGAPPFPGPGVSDLLRQHLSMAAPAAHDLRPDVPRALDAVLQRLLRKDPVDRYQSASAVAHDLEALRSALAAGDPDPRLTVGRVDHRQHLTDPAFVGREAELESLQTVLTRIGEGGSGLVLLDAESGGGKSRLLAELASQAVGLGVTVLHGQGIRDGVQLPFTLIQGVARDLAGRDDAEALRVGLRARLGDSAEVTANVLGALRPMLGVADDAVGLEAFGPDAFGEERSLVALRQFLAAIATPDNPVLLVLDDCQWADALTVRLLTQAFAADVDLPAYLGVVASFRSEEVGPEDPLRTIATAQALHLGRLSDRAMTLLAESMAGPLPDQAVAIVTRLADGSPFMGAAVLRGLVECGALTASPGGWLVDETALAEVQTERRSAAVLVRRLDLLPEGVLRALSVGAVLGKEFDIVQAVELAGQSELAAPILEESLRRRLLWVDPRTGRCTFFHDRIREALLDRLDTETREHLHSRIADALLLGAVDDAEVFDVAYHLDAAHRHADALPHALRAAEVARAQYGLDSALAHYRMAERGAEPRDRATRAVIATGMGDVLTLRGAYADAKSALVRARDLVEDPMAKASLDEKLGGLAFKQGDLPTARRHLEGAMAQLGRPVPTRAPMVVLRLVWELIVQVCHSWLPTLTTGRRSPVGRDEDFLAMRIHSRLAYVYWFSSGTFMCAWSHFRGLNLAERYPPSAELGQACSEHAPVMTMVPWFGRSLRYAQRSLEIRRARNDPWGQGQSLGFAGVTLYAASRFEEGVDACREAIRLLESTGDQWEVNTASWNLAMCLYRQGKLDAAVEVARSTYESAMAIGDETSAGVALSVWTRASGGRVDSTLIEAELARGSADLSTTAELHFAAAVCAIREGDLVRAAREGSAAAGVVRAGGLRQEYAAPIASWNATIARLVLEATSPYDGAGRAQLLRAYRRAVRRARLWSFSYRNNAPHTLREAGLLAGLRGRHRASLRLLDRSIAVAEDQGATYEAALSRQARSRVVAARGGDERSVVEATEVVLALERLLEPRPAEEESDPTVSLFDRFATLLSVGREIAAAPSTASLEAVVRQAALTLLRAERCDIVSVADVRNQKLVTVSGERADAISHTLVTRAIETGAPVSAGDLSGDGSESMLLSEIRSALAAPIMVDGKALWCLYVTHSQLGALFGEEELQLASFVATLAGAAFEHLAGTEARFRTIGQNSSDVLTLVDRDGVVTYQSSAASRVFALPAVGIVGRPIRDWVHPGDRALFDDALARAIREDQYRVECRLMQTDGSFRHAETSITHLLDDPAVEALVLHTHDVTERRRLEDELRERALSDELTGLPNRVLFLERTRHALDRREAQSLVVCFLDLDDFKAVNDAHGHGAGDKLLRAIGERLTDAVRPGDTVARFGGDEFALLLEDTDLEAAVPVVERLLEAINQPVDIGDIEVVIHASVGLAESNEWHRDTDGLLAEADAAMYAAKGRGSNGYEAFRTEMRLEAESRSRVRTDLDLALAQDEFWMHYQPIVDLRTDERLGVEALIRWLHPQRGLLTPADFIDQAETSGQIGAIGEWALRAACQATAGLATDVYMSVNISARQLRQPGLVDVVGQALAASGLAAGRLVLEITETATVGDLAGATARLKELKALGVQLALDDFGTGYAPLTYLRSFPVDILKIDRSFVRNVEHSHEDRAIVRGVIDIAHHLGLRTVAEGIERPRQLEIMRDLGCSSGQGYLWTRPIPIDELEPTLAGQGAGVVTQEQSWW